MEVLVLDSTTKSLEINLDSAVTSNQLPWVVSYGSDDSTFTEVSSDGVTNDASFVTICPQPTGTKKNIVKSIFVENADTATAKFYIYYNNNGTRRLLFSVILSPNETWTLNGAYSAYGERKGIGNTGGSGWSGISGNFQSGWSGVSGNSGRSGISGKADSGWSGISGSIGPIGPSGISGNFQSGWSGISGNFQSGWSGISGNFQSGWSGVSGNSGWSGISGKADSGWSGVSGNFQSGWSGISGKTDSGWSGISGNFQSGWSGVSGNFQSGWSGISGNINYQIFGGALDSGGGLFALTTTETWVYPVAEVASITFSPSDISNSFLFPVSKTLAKVHVVLDTAPGIGETTTFSIYKNGTITVFQIVISDSNISGNDTSNSVSFSESDFLIVSFVKSSGSATNDLTWSFVLI